MERVVWEIFVLLLFSLASECGGISDKAAEEPRKRHLFVQRSQPLPGSSKKLLKIEYEEPPRFSAEQEEPEFLRRVRRSVDPDMNPEAHVFRFNDSHYHAYVHWAGDHRDTIVVLMRDPIPTARSNSHVWISRNYGQSFVNRTGSFRTSKGVARIDMFYPSPLDNTRYLFVDRQNGMIYSTLDDCQTVINSSVRFVAVRFCWRLPWQYLESWLCEARGTDRQISHSLTVTPSPDLTPLQVVLVQAYALHSGRIDVCFRFASPLNKLMTGPYERFSRLFDPPSRYSMMLGCDRFQVEEEKGPEHHFWRSFVVTFWNSSSSPRSKTQSYLWQLSRSQMEEGAPWCTDSVIDMDSFWDGSFLEE